MTWIRERRKKNGREFKLGVSAKVDLEEFKKRKVFVDSSSLSMLTYEDVRR